MNGAAWTPEELAILRRHYHERGGPARVVALTGRTIAAVHRRAAVAGVAERRAHKPWTEADTEFLREHIGSMQCRSIARRLKRAPGSVFARAAALGLSFREEREWFTTTDVEDLLHVTAKTVSQWCREGTLRAERHEGARQRTGLPNGVMWRIDRADLRRFIIVHAVELTNRPVNMPVLLDVLGISGEFARAVDQEQQGDRARKEETAA